MSKTLTKTLIWVGIAVVFIGVLLLAIFFAEPWGVNALIQDKFIAGVLEARDYIENSGFPYELAFIGLQIFSVFSMLLPAGSITFVGAMLFGGPLGFLYAYLACVVANMLCFFLTRLLGRKFVQKMLAGKLSKYEKFFNEKSALLAVIFMVFPYLPADTMSYLMGLTKIKWWKYLLICIFGRPWRILLYVAMAASATTSGLPAWVYVMIIEVAVLLMYFSVKYSAAIESFVLRKFGAKNKQEKAAEVPTETK